MVATVQERAPKVVVAAACQPGDMIQGRHYVKRLCTAFSKLRIVVHRFGVAPEPDPAEVEALKRDGVLDPDSACVVSLGPTVVISGLSCHGEGARASVGATPPTPPAGEGGPRAAADGAAEDRALGKYALGANVLGVVVIADGTSASAAATKPQATRIPAGGYRVATNGDQVQLLAESGQVSAAVPW